MNGRGILSVSLSLSLADVESTQRPLSRNVPDSISIIHCSCYFHRVTSTLHSTAGISADDGPASTARVAAVALPAGELLLL